jgi:hypothetical protein
MSILKRLIIYCHQRFIRHPRKAKDATRQLQHIQSQYSRRLSHERGSHNYLSLPSFLYETKVSWISSVEAYVPNTNACQYVAEAATTTATATTMTAATATAAKHEKNHAHNNQKAYFFGSQLRFEIQIFKLAIQMVVVVVAIERFMSIRLPKIMSNRLPKIAFASRRCHLQAGMIFHP